MAALNLLNGRFLTLNVVYLLGANHYNGVCMGYPDMMRDILAQARRDVIVDRKKALENLPIVDGLTGLYRREYFDLRLDEEMTRSRLYGNKLSLIFIDTGLALRVDQGRESLNGDKAIQIIAGIISDCLKAAVAIAFVYDTGKFAVILPEATMQEAIMTADHIRETIVREKLPGVIPHAGIVQYKDHEDIGELIQATDAALYANNV